MEMRREEIEVQEQYRASYTYTLYIYAKTQIIYLYVYKNDVKCSIILKSMMKFEGGGEGINRLRHLALLSTRISTRQTQETHCIYNPAILVFSMGYFFCLFFENKKHTCFYLRFTNEYYRKSEFRFSKQNTYKLKDLRLFKVLWTTY